MNKYYMSSKSRFNDTDKENLKIKGFNYFYELQDGEGLSYSIQKCVFINNIGCIATNFKITECETDYISDRDFFNIYKPIEETNFSEV